MSASPANQSPYATSIGLVYVFNLIIGTGALALPKAFSDAGWATGVILLVVSAFISYVNATFVVECMAAANGVLTAKRLRRSKHLAVTETVNANDDSAISESQPILTRSSSSQSGLQASPVDGKPEYFDITQRTELSDIAKLFLNKYGVYFFFAILALYLFGDIAITTVLASKSILNVICVRNGSSLTALGNFSTRIDDMDENVPCRMNWPVSVTRMTIYRFVVAAFALVVGPFVYVGMSKTKYLQIFTTVGRWMAFLLMITLGLKRIIAGQATGHPPAFHMDKFAPLFGISVYAFMCHHSLPAVVTPMRQKSHIHLQFFLVYLLILAFYLLLSMSGAFAFENLQDVYTLQFLNDSTGTKMLWYDYIMNYFLALYPVFTVSMNFPIAAVTLSNNLRGLLGWQMTESEPTPVEVSSNYENMPPDSDPTISSDESNLIPPRAPSETAIAYTQPTRWVRYRSSVLIPTIVIIFPIGIALITDDVEMLASTVGSFCGVGVQFVIPSMLVMASRSRCRQWLGAQVPAPLASPFQLRIWPWLMFAWALFSLVVVSLKYALSTK